MDLHRPTVGFAAIKLLEDAGCLVEVPVTQTCCGQPAYNNGDRRAAQALGRWIYPGPMGSVLTPSLIGVETSGHLPNASTFCGTCESVCPVKIPLPKMMRHWREREFERHLQPGGIRSNLGIWAWLGAHGPRRLHVVLIEDDASALGG